jgi:hypothetical protein
MAENTEIQIKVNVDTGNSNKEIQQLTNEIEDLKKAYSEAAEGSEEKAEALKKLTAAENKLSDAVKKNEKETESNTKTQKQAENQSKKSEGGFKSLINVIKGLGVIGLASAAFDVFKESLMKNQKVADAVNTIMTTIQNTLGAFIEVVVNVIDKVSKSSNGFDALGKVVSGLLTLSITPLKLAFNGIALFIQKAQLAWEESFFGDSDPATIKALNEKIKETKESLAETADAAVNAGKDIYNNFGEAVSQVTDVVSGVVEGASKISVKSIYDQAKATTALKNTAKIAQAELQGLVEKYDRQAELQRQIRDDETKSISDRIAANNQLGKILKEQQAAQLSLANTRIAAAQAELSANKGSIELQVALKEAQNERAAILAQIAGLESEQKVNAIALDKELLELNKARTASEQQLATDRQKANADAIKDELQKNIILQQIRDDERQKELARLQSNIDATNEGTQARLDAEIEYNTKKQELDIADDAARVEREKIIRQRQLDENAARTENALAESNLKRQLIEQEKISAFDKAQKVIELAREESRVQIEAINAKRDAEILAAEQAGLSSVEIRNKYAIQAQTINAQLAKSETDLAKARVDAQVSAADAIADSLGKLAQLFGEQTKVGKGLSVASTTISTITAAQKAYESAQTLPFGLGAIIGPINAGIAIATGVANIKKILAVKIPGTSGGGGGANLPTNQSQGGQVQAPITPQVGSTLINQAQVNQIGSAAARAYVVESDVSGNQERIQRINRAARIS